jgi:Zn-dependent M28 family amino/carboxypeptidase
MWIIKRCRRLALATPPNEPFSLSFSFFLQLLGSKYFVSNATASHALANIAMNINSDMLGSPNGIIQVLDGSQANVVEVRNSSAVIQQVFERYFSSIDQPWSLKAFNGRSDYGSFSDVGIAAGGLASGAEVIKTPEERATFGGIANAAFDPCYHQSCDTIDNINFDILLTEAQATAHALSVFGQVPDLDSFLGIQTPTGRSTRDQLVQQRGESGRHLKRWKQDWY